jgi:hypothetical protein
LITQYYYSIDSLLDCKRVALVYSPYFNKAKMSEYVIGRGMFDYETVIVANEDGILESDIIDIPGYDDFMFNTILVLNETSDIVAFVRMDSPIKPSLYSTKKITVTFEYDVETHFKGGLVLTMDYHSHISNEAEAHKQLLSVNDRGDKVAMCKDDIYFVETARNPYYADLSEFAAASDGLLKYSGNLFYKSGGATYRLDGNAFRYSGNNPLGFVTLDGDVQALVYHDGGKIWVSLESGDQAVLMSGVRRDQVEAVLVDCIIVNGNSENYPAPGRNMYRVSDLYGGEVIPLPLDASLRYVADAVTSRSMFYYLTSGYRINLETMSHELRRIMDGVMIDNEEQPGELVSATDGLLVYKVQGGFLLCSCQAITNGGAFTDRFLCDCDSVCVLSNSAVLLIKTSEDGSEAWQMAELVNEGNDFRWEVTYFGQRNGMYALFPAMYRIARRRSSTPKTLMATGLSYRGLQYAFAESTAGKQLISI